MSVVVVIKVPGDTAKFLEFFEANAEMVGGISQGARAVGCTHHVFAKGDGEIIVVDHWSTREAFEKFFSAPEIAEVMGKAGASGPPAFEFFDVFESIDSF
jgi:heme-degrading monooxygenase HmoA